MRVTGVGINEIFIGLMAVALAVLILCAVGARGYEAGRVEGYKAGQVDALRGVVKYELRENDIGEMVWRDVGGE